MWKWCLYPGGVASTCVKSMRPNRIPMVQYIIAERWRRSSTPQKWDHSQSDHKPLNWSISHVKIGLARNFNLSNVPPTLFLLSVWGSICLQASIAMLNTIMQTSEEISLHYLCFSYEAIFIQSVIDHFHVYTDFHITPGIITFMAALMKLYVRTKGLVESFSSHARTFTVPKSHEQNAKCQKGSWNPVNVVYRVHIHEMNVRFNERSNNEFLHCSFRWNTRATVRMVLFLKCHCGFTHSTQNWPHLWILDPSVINRTECVFFKANKITTFVFILAPAKITATIQLKSTKCTAQLFT